MHARRATMTSKASPIWPREHGATMELLFPLASVWLLGRATVATFALGVAAICAFVAHEPLLVLAGRRGARRRLDERSIALRRLVALGATSAVLAAIGLALADSTTRLVALVPIATGAAAAVIALRGGERNLAGELYAALALTAVALPVATAAGLSCRSAFALTAVWLVGFALATTAARGVVIRGRDTGRALRLASFAAAAVLAAGVALAVSGRTTAAIAFAPAPFAVAVIALALRPPTPKSMTTVGVALAAAGAVTLALLHIDPL